MDGIIRKLEILDILVFSGVPCELYFYILPLMELRIEPMQRE